MCRELQLARPTALAGPAGVTAALRAEGHLGARFRGPTSSDPGSGGQRLSGRGSWDRGWGAAEGKGPWASRPRPGRAPSPAPPRSPLTAHRSPLTGDAGGCGGGLGQLGIPASGKQEAGIRK